MTEEEMAEQYADTVKCEWENDTYWVDCRDKVTDSFLAGLKAGKDMNVATKWHKVVDGDLPKRVDDYVTNIGVLTYDSYGNGVYKWHTPHCEACDYAEEVDGNEVIAWCEIPKYTEE